MDGAGAGDGPEPLSMAAARIEALRPTVWLQIPEQLTYTSTYT